MEKIYDVIIVGAGPAGLSAGIYTSRAIFSTLILNSFNFPSQIVFTDIVENYSGFPEGINGFELVENFKKQAMKFGCKLLDDEVKDIKKTDDGFLVYVTNSKNYLKSKSIILATGRRAKKLGLENEDTLIGKGISYCAVCDAALYKDKVVAVVGGGDTAFTEAIFISKFVKKLYVIHRKTQFRATKILQKRLFEKNNVEFLTPCIIQKILGKEKLEALEILNLQTEKNFRLDCDGLFVCIGHQPNTEFLNGFVNMDQEGYILTDDRLQTSQHGVFACGDCRSGSIKQVISASAEGVKAAFSVIEHLEQQG